MARTSKEIAKDLLKQANYYWYDDNKDSVNPLNPEDYDPVVDKIFKANAVELEKLYAEIAASEREVIIGLSKSLAPDQSLLPEPGYTVAQVSPKAQRLTINPFDSFQIVGQSDIGEKYQYYFTPIFEHRYPKCEIKFMVTEDAAVKIENNAAEAINEVPGLKTTKYMWLGLDLGKAEDEDIISFFLGNKIFDEFDKDHSIFHAAKWYINGEPTEELHIEKGIDIFNKKLQEEEAFDLLEELDIAGTYEKQICTRFRNGFIQVPISSKLNNQKVKLPPQLLENDLISESNVQEPLCWIKLEFSVSIASNFFKKNHLYSNCIPLVNRNRIQKFVVKRNYDRILLPMPTNDFFLDIDKVQDAKNKQDEPETKYQRINVLDPDSEPGTFMIRSGSRIRRLNRNDATEQIYRLLEVVEDEYSTFKEEGVNRLKEDFDVIEKAINRIKSQMPNFFREESAKSPYFCIANFRPRVTRLEYSYWETQGDLIEHLGDKVKLTVTSKDVKVANSFSIIPIQKGKAELTSDDFINQVKISLLSRGRIMTRADIELYCKSRYGRFLEVGHIGREIMMGEDGQLERGLLVIIKLKQNIPEQTIEFIRIELQNDLNAKSAFFTPIKIEIEK